MMTILEHLQQLFPQIPGLQSEGQGSYSYPLYATSDDTLTDDQLAAIATADGPKMDAFYDQLDDIYNVWQDDTFIALIEDIRKLWQDTAESQENALTWDDVKDVVHNFVRDYITFPMDYDHFLRQRVYVNIIVNTGDGNTDYTCNDLIPTSNRYSVQIPSESSLLWLTRQQGYTKRDLRRAIKQGGSPQNRLLQSIYEECLNVTTVMNALTFFVTMTLQQYIDWVDSGRDLTVSADTACGLWDPWAGGGSTLEIALEKPVTILFQYAEPAFDGVRGNYSVTDTYGMLRRFWTDTVIPRPRPCA